MTASPRTEKARDWRRNDRPGKARRGRYQADAGQLVSAAFRAEYKPGPVESQFRSLYRELIAGAGGRSWHAYDSRRSDEGWPDEATILHGRLFFVELKAPGKKPTDRQVETLQLLNDCRGVQAYLVTSSGNRGRDLLLLQELLDRALA